MVTSDRGLLSITSKSPACGVDKLLFPRLCNGGFFGWNGLDEQPLPDGQLSTKEEPALTK